MQRPYCHDIPDYSTQPELAVAALIHMLVRFPVVGRAAMAESIERHLDIVAADTRLPTAIREAALIAAQDWHAMLVPRRSNRATNMRTSSTESVPA